MEEALDEASRSFFLPNNHVLPWRFIPTGTLKVNDRNTKSHIGELFWKDDNFVTGPAFQVRDWVFGLIRPTGDDLTWRFCAFQGNRFYCYCGLERVKQSNELRQNFMGITVGMFWPILHPETFDGVDGDPYDAARKGKITFSTVLGPRGIQEFLLYSRSGGTEEL